MSVYKTVAIGRDEAVAEIMKSLYLADNETLGNILFELVGREGANIASTRFFLNNFTVQDGPVPTESTEGDDWS